MKNLILKYVMVMVSVSLLSMGVGLGDTLQDRLYDAYGIDLHGFIDIRYGKRLQEDPTQKDASIHEARFQLDIGRDFDWGVLKLKGDLVGDNVEKNYPVELREANILLSPLDNLDLKIGRQTITWGTGDLLFINDTFAKDWKSFFIGRDNEYLKAPVDALKFSLFFNVVNLDLVWQPLFNGSTYIDGKRLSYWNPLLGRIAGRDYIFTDQERNRVFREGEYALRLSKNFRGIELALYGSHGFWKTPEGIDAATMELFYPRLNTYGASARSTLLGGVGNIEAGYLESRNDKSGSNPFIRNSEWRVLAGFEREIVTNFSASVQYYVEWMDNYAEYKRSLNNGPVKDEYRQVATLRLTRLMMNQNLILSLFSYYSPSDRDGYVRPRITYKVSDNWMVETGGNIFFGHEPHTFFGQFEDNTNLFGGIRINY